MYIYIYMLFFLSPFCSACYFLFHTYSIIFNRSVVNKFKKNNRNYYINNLCVWDLLGDQNPSLIMVMKLPLEITSRNISWLNYSVSAEVNCNFSRRVKKIALRYRAWKFMVNWYLLQVPSCSNCIINIYLRKRDA